MDRTSGQVRLWSRQKKDLTARFPDLAAAAAHQVPTRREAVSWADDRLDSEALQRRLTTSPRSIRRLVDEEPATHVAFDFLAVAGRDLREHPYWVRRQLLEELAKGLGAAGETISHNQRSSDRTAMDARTGPLRC